MSIGPLKQNEELAVPLQSRVQYLAKVSITGFFSDPIHYLFYGTLTVMIVGLIFNIKFPWELYAILSILSVVKLYKYRKLEDSQYLAKDAGST